MPGSVVSSSSTIGLIARRAGGRRPLNQRRWTFWRAALFSGARSTQSVSAGWDPRVCESARLPFLCEASVCLSVNCWLRPRHLLPAKYGCYPQKTRESTLLIFGQTFATLNTRCHLVVSLFSLIIAPTRKLQVSDSAVKADFRCKIWIILVLWTHIGNSREMLLRKRKMLKSLNTKGKEKMVKHLLCV